MFTFYMISNLCSLTRIDSFDTIYYARHHCYAYRIKTTNGIEQKQSDDGEPSGTAGLPIWNVLERNQLDQTLIVVIRYFGGTKLGAGPLLRAYSNAANALLKD